MAKSNSSAQCLTKFDLKLVVPGHADENSQALTNEENPDEQNCKTFNNGRTGRHSWPLRLLGTSTSG